LSPTASRQRKKNTIIAKPTTGRACSYSLSILAEGAPKLRHSILHTSITVNHTVHPKREIKEDVLLLQEEVWQHHQQPDNSPSKRHRRSVRLSGPRTADGEGVKRHCFRRCLWDYGCYRLFHQSKSAPVPATHLSRCRTLLPGWSPANQICCFLLAPSTITTTTTTSRLSLVRAPSPPSSASVLAQAWGSPVDCSLSIPLPAIRPLSPRLLFLDG
jgi:hypothetical protein